jgi:hypothetical protein
MKVFVVERLASLVLLDRRFTSLAYGPFALRRTGITASYLDEEMRTADPGHIASFQHTRAKVIRRCAAVAG